MYKLVCTTVTLHVRHNTVGVGSLKANSAWVSFWVSSHDLDRDMCVICVACNLRTCAVCSLHGAKYAVCRLHGTQSADCIVTVQTKDPSKTCDSFSKFQRNLRFSARINFLTKLPNLKENNLCLFDNGYYSFSCL